MDLKQRAILAEKLMAIQRFVAKQHGMGELGDLSASEYQRVIKMTTRHLEIWKQLVSEGHPGPKEKRHSTRSLGSILP